MGWQLDCRGYFECLLSGQSNRFERRLQTCGSGQRGHRLEYPEGVLAGRRAEILAQAPEAAELNRSRAATVKERVTPCGTTALRPETAAPTARISPGPCRAARSSAPAPRERWSTCAPRAAIAGARSPR